MQAGNSKKQQAEKVVRELLLPSRICAVSLRNDWPEIYFENSKLQIESSLWIDSDWRIEPAPQILSQLTEKQSVMVLLGELAGDEVHDIHCLSDGGLIVELASKQRLIIAGVPQDQGIIEPWILSERGRGATEGAAKVVAIARDGFAVWARDPTVGPAKNTKADSPHQK